MVYRKEKEEWKEKLEKENTDWEVRLEKETKEKNDLKVQIQHDIKETNVWKEKLEKETRRLEDTADAAVKKIQVELENEKTIVTALQEELSKLKQEDADKFWYVIRPQLFFWFFFFFFVQEVDSWIYPSFFFFFFFFHIHLIFDWFIVTGNWYNKSNILLFPLALSSSPGFSRN